MIKKKLRQKFDQMERCFGKNKAEYNALVQHSYCNNVILSHITHSLFFFSFFSDDTLKESVISVLIGSDIFGGHQDKEASYRFGKP